VRRTLSIFQKVCDAIAFAHRRRFCHRNLKPENIIIAIMGGLCNRLGRDTEQRAFAEGRQLAQNPYPDIAALGKILYEIITLTSPLDRNRLGGESNIDSRGLLRVEAPRRRLRNLLGAANARWPAVAQQLSFGSRIPAGSGHLQDSF